MSQSHGRRQRGQAARPPESAEPMQSLCPSSGAADLTTAARPLGCQQPPQPTGLCLAGTKALCSALSGSPVQTTSPPQLVLKTVAH